MLIGPRYKRIYLTVQNMTCMAKFHCISGQSRVKFKMVTQRNLQNLTPKMFSTNTNLKSFKTHYTSFNAWQVVFENKCFANIV